MAAFEDFRQLLILYYDANLINDEDFVLLYDMFPSRNPSFPYYEYASFDLNNMSEAECKAEFRFEKKDLPTLAEALQIPPTFKLRQGSIVSGMEGLCILLRRLAYPCRFGDMVPRFGKPVPVLSMVTNHVIDYIYTIHGHRITRWNDALLNPPALDTYARSVHAKGAALQNCFGFVDGTVRPIARPDEHQRMMYNGHKRVHAIKFQSVALPNGLIANLYGPVEGKRHDAGMLAESGLLHDLERHAFSTGGQPLCIYGDPAYPLRVHLQGPFQGAALTPQMEMFNGSMSSVRVSVEWLFGDILNYFKFLDFKKNLKVGLSNIGKTYVVCALMRNALTCLYGNQTSEFFN
ncbi:uncharacterized protein [Montipora capricornis]|uniref:uncharacterized protein n=1 Tax=Montipora capricornis TaxID=246305 RepID=UPI0035F1962C